VPGHNLDDVDAAGEPRRIVYHWPNVYMDPAADSAPEAAEPVISTPYADSGAAPELQLRDDHPTDGSLPAPDGPDEHDPLGMSVVHARSAVGVSARRGG
jgi:hypothetical protein